VTYALRHAAGTASQLTAHPKVLIVHHSTADISWVSRGFVDASDVSPFFAAVGKDPCYGNFNEIGLNCAPWYCDLNADGVIDAGDVGRFAASLGDGCAIPKVDADQQRASLMAWFGLTYTGRNIHERDGVTTPEVAITDPVRWQQGLLDPTGYVNRVARSASATHWARIKLLYR